MENILTAGFLPLSGLMADEQKAPERDDSKCLPVSMIQKSAPAPVALQQCRRCSGLISALHLGRHGGHGDLLGVAHTVSDNSSPAGHSERKRCRSSTLFTTRSLIATIRSPRCRPAREAAPSGPERIFPPQSPRSTRDSAQCACPKTAGCRRCPDMSV